ncbi:hypothetical protein IQ272_22500 [Chroococcidiopsidales cyanobacterium LEGE 13417]|nr:hypothetical protein [Chroococcidiopsidales cyanobacterium LEGE 13417]
MLRIAHQKSSRYPTNVSFAIATTSVVSYYCKRFLILVWCDVKSSVAIAVDG